jgi:hypothetical protein
MPKATITRLRSRIAQHRRGRHARSPLPPALWAEATTHAREVGAYAAARQLGVSYESLRRRLDDRRAKSPPTTFVELDVSAPWPLSGSGPVVEVVEPSGAKLTVSGSAVDAAELVRAFRQERA